MTIFPNSVVMILAQARGTDLTGRLNRLIESGGTDAIITFVFLAIIAVILSTRISTKSLSLLYVFCLMFSGHQVELVDSSSTMLRWMLIMCFVLATISGRRRYEIGLICTMLGLHWTYAVISVLWSPSAYTGLQLSLLSLLLTVPAAMALSDEMQRTQVIDGLPRIFNLCSIIYIANAVFRLSDLSGARFSGMIVSAPLFVITGGLLMPCLLWGYVTATTERSRLSHAVGFVLVFSLCFLSGQRTGFFAGLLGCIPLLLARRGKRGSLITIALMLAGVFAFAGVQVFPEQAEFIRRRYITTDVTGRDHLWWAGIKFIYDNPFVGYGAGSHESRGFGFHNAFLQQWHNCGISGLLLFGGAFALLFVKAGRLTFDARLGDSHQELARLVWGWSISMIAGACFEDKLTSPSNILAFVAVNAGLMIHYLEKEASKRGRTLQTSSSNSDGRLFGNKLRNKSASGRLL